MDFYKWQYYMQKIEEAETLEDIKNILLQLVNMIYMETPEED